MNNFIFNGYKLDNYQSNVIYNESKYLLVVAGAGSGKTLTIVGKIFYLINIKKVSPDEILCISFTNEAVNNLKRKINNDLVDIMTFHKLGLKVLKDNYINVDIISSDYLEYIVHEFFLGIVFENKIVMKNILKYFNQYFISFNIEKKYTKFIKNNFKTIISFEKLICKFIRLFKTNNYSIKSFIDFKKSCKKRKEKLFLSIAINIYIIYKNELDSSMKIDFDDMLIKSSEIIKNGGLIKNYKYIIIDEYQDTSYIRYLLINEIVKRNNSSLIAVGDDFQSIYRFSGCDLKIFTDFNTYYKDAYILKLENTYRNSRELVDVCGDFIMRNKSQIEKHMKSNKSICKPIKICYGYSLKELIMLIKGNIMILGRNNNDIYKYIDKDFVIDGDKIILENFEGINLKYYTVHRSKGLEEDNVIILNVIDETTGFPNKIEDNNIIRFVSKKSEKSFDEERRLFYVALTRTKNNVYLMTKKGRESIFIKEIKKNSKLFIEIIKKQ